VEDKKSKGKNDEKKEWERKRLARFRKVED
jgi:hypothetical protein